MTNDDDNDAGDNDDDRGLETSVVGCRYSTIICGVCGGAHKPGVLATGRCTCRHRHPRIFKGHRTHKVGVIEAF